MVVKSSCDSKQKLTFLDALSHHLPNFSDDNSCGECAQWIKLELGLIKR